jgi:hypothetical protein
MEENMSQATGRATARATNPEFQSWPLNQHGVEKVAQITAAFDVLLNEVKEAIGQESRYFSLVKTKLEEGCMIARKGVAIQPGNQE